MSPGRGAGRKWTSDEKTQDTGGDVRGRADSGANIPDAGGAVDAKMVLGASGADICGQPMRQLLIMGIPAGGEGKAAKAQIWLSGTG
ncbi:MAG: hypothetical protein ACRDBM_00480 [Sporomusa sp.]